MLLFEPSISSRFVATVIANLLRGGLNFFATMAIARVLGPEVYGDYAFLLASFIATMNLLDMGTSNAFKTFLFQKKQGKMFVLSYAVWQLLQIFIILLIIGVVLPKSWLGQLWLGQEKNLILFGFAALFIQQKAWQTLTQIGEAERLTHRVQILNVSIAAVHLILIIGFWVGGILSINVIFGLILTEYLFFLPVAYKVLFVSKLVYFVM